MDSLRIFFCCPSFLMTKELQNRISLDPKAFSFLIHYQEAQIQENSHSKKSFLSYYIFDDISHNISDDILCELYDDI